MDAGVVRSVTAELAEREREREVGLPQLQVIAKAGSLEDRVRAVRGVGRTKGPVAAAALRYFLDHKEGRIRAAAGWAMAAAAVALVVVLLVAAVLVVLARVGVWQQAFVSDRAIRYLTWALAGIFLLETVAAFTWGRGEPEWRLYGPVSLLIAVLSLIVAGSDGAWSRRRGPHRTLPLH